MTAEGEPRTVRLENVFADWNGRFEAWRRYRVSFFVRLADVVSHGKGGGAGYRSMVPEIGREYASSGAVWKRFCASGASRKPL